MPDYVPQEITLSELQLHQDKVLKMAETAPVLLMSQSQPAGVLISPQEWGRLMARLAELELLQEARLNIARNDTNQSWLSSAQMRQKMKKRGVDVGSLVRS